MSVVQDLQNQIIEIDSRITCTDQEIERLQLEFKKSEATLNNIKEGLSDLEILWKDGKKTEILDFNFLCSLNKKRKILQANLNQSKAYVNGFGCSLNIQLLLKQELANTKAKLEKSLSESLNNVYYICQ
jgi:hypothetical protein